MENIGEKIVEGMYKEKKVQVEEGIAETVH